MLLPRREKIFGNLDVQQHLMNFGKDFITTNQGLCNCTGVENVEKNGSLGTSLMMSFRADKTQFPYI